ncbi:hypothetical protein pb186bvf_002815 [Paramecium bursaria]
MINIDRFSNQLLMAIDFDTNESQRLAPKISIKQERRNSNLPALQLSRVTIGSIFDDSQYIYHKYGQRSKSQKQSLIELNYHANTVLLKRISTDFIKNIPENEKMNGEKKFYNFFIYLFMVCISCYLLPLSVVLFVLWDIMKPYFEKLGLIAPKPVQKQTTEIQQS